MRGQILAFISLVVVAGLARFVPHPPNFSPILGVALFAGAKAPKRWLGLLVPVAILWLSDLLIGVHYLMLVTGALVLASSAIGVVSEKGLSGQNSRAKWIGWGAAGFLASALFFFVSNLAVWWSSGIYPRTPAGLADSYLMALPFFHMQVVSTWLFTGVLLAAWAAIQPSFASSFEKN